MFIPLKDENPTERKPFFTVGLIALNLIIFLFTYLSGSFSYYVYNYGVIPAEIASGEGFFTIFSSMFLHAGIFHLIGNIWFLWIFGDNIEDLFGKAQFLVIYFGAGVVASLAHIAFNPGSTTPTIGASGAIAGVLGAYLVKYPRVNVITLFYLFLVRVPSFVFLGIWIGFQLYIGTYTTVAGENVSVAYWAHIGGFVAGALLAKLLRERKEAKKSKKRIPRDYFMER